MTTARSLLYTPGTRPDRVGTARSCGADAVIVDLEDAVPWDEKPRARDGVAAALAEAANTPGAPVWVRINSDDFSDDLEAALAPALAGLVLPKAEPALLARLDAALAGNQVPVIALIETAAGVLHADELAGHQRVARLAVGEADLGAELRISPEEAGAFDAIRLQVVLASSAAGLPAPIGPVERQLHAEDALARSSQRLLRQGFRGRTALHPRQIAAINDAFSPSPEDIRRARAMIEEFDSAQTGTLVRAGGEFVDRAVLRQAREVLERADPD
jgi:citrate lyase subunit beta/citryl-CoA lyase